MNPKFLALLSALLAGIAPPLAKILLGSIDPIPLAGLLYLGCGLSLLIIKIFKKEKNGNLKIERSDIKWLVGGVVAGGILAPIIMLTSLKVTPAATASLLINFETVATALLAGIFFKEVIGKRVWLAVGSVTLAAILLSLTPHAGWGFSAGALGIILACALWGLDNNFTRKISAKDPFVIVIAKGLGAGIFSILLALFLNEPFPPFNILMGALLLGAVAYGLSLICFVLALRGLGSARTSALFGTAPFLGAVLSFFIFKTPLTGYFVTSLPFMALGAYLILNENHE